MKATILLTTIGLLHATVSSAQLAVSAAVNVALTDNANDCTNRTISTTVTGGSGDYIYSYAKFPGQLGPEIVTQSTSEYLINPQPTAKTMYFVTVYDMQTYTSAFTLVAAPGKLSNDFSSQYWSNVFTPNGDGVNEEFYPIFPAGTDGDNWEANKQVLAGVYRVKLQIASHDGLVFLDLDINRPNLSDNPIRYGEIYWNGRIGNAGYGWIAWPGTYYYTLTLYNCNYPEGKTFKKWLMLFR